MKYLILNFKDAGLFRKIDKNGVNIKSKDTIFTNNVNIDRHQVPYFVEPITVHQISNMIHVLFNERPVPSLRTSMYEKNDYYFQKAKSSFLVINNPKVNFDNFYYETMQTTKAKWNSWAIVGSNWELVEKYIGNKENYAILKNKLSELLPTIDVPFASVINSIRSLPIEKRIEIYNTIESLNGCGGLYYCIGINKNGELTKPDTSKITSAPKRCARTINRGIGSVAKLSGQVLVPVTDDDINFLKTKSKGCATLLDGGLVWIDSIVDGNALSSEGFTRVSDISDAKSIPLNV